MVRCLTSRVPWVALHWVVHFMGITVWFQMQREIELGNSHQWWSWWPMLFCIQMSNLTSSWFLLLPHNLTVQSRPCLLALASQKFITYSRGCSYTDGLIFHTSPIMLVNVIFLGCMCTSKTNFPNNNVVLCCIVLKFLWNVEIFNVWGFACHEKYIAWYFCNYF